MFVRSFSFTTVLSLGLALVGPSFAAAAPLGGAMPACPASDPVVWENSSSKSKAYHVRGDRFFGTTKHGAYACQSEAEKAGYHAAKMRAMRPGTAGSSGAAATDTTPATAASAMPDPMASPMAGGKHHRKHKRGSMTGTPEPTAT